MVMGAGANPSVRSRGGRGVDLKVGGSIPLRCASMLVGELAAFQAVPDWRRRRGSDDGERG